MGRRWRGAMPLLQGGLAGSTPNVSKIAKVNYMRYIYCITNLLNGKNYFGQHKLQKGRTLQSDLYYGSGKLIKAAQKKYGLKNFKKEILVSGEFSKEEINRFERCIIACQRICGKAEYNIADGGDGGDLSKFIDYSKINNKEGYRKRKEAGTQAHWKKHDGFAGKHHSEETKKKMSDANKENHKGSKNSQFGTHWYTNGEINIKAKECPEGFRPGRV